MTFENATHLNVILADSALPADRVDLPAMFGAKGIEHAEDRVELVVGDVMQPFPQSVQKAGVDTLVMKHFLSAFNDKDAILILKHCSQVLAPQGKILLLQVFVKLVRCVVFVHLFQRDIDFNCCCS